MSPEQILALAKDYHELTDHARDGDKFGAPLCTCLLVALRVSALGYRKGQVA